VTSGTVSVMMTAGGTSTTLTAAVTVTNRSGWPLTAVTATAEPNGYSGSSACGVMSVPSPPQNGGLLGLSCLQQAYSFNWQAVNDNGPNQGFKYVTSFSSSNGTTATRYFYIVSPDAANPNSTFAQAQCGNYNASTNPNGYISQPHLIANITRHESGSLNSHYSEYVSAQNSSANNLGAVAEQTVGTPSDGNFSGTLNSAIQSKEAAIQSAMNVEPCSANYDGSVTPCVFQGYVNYLPYATCN
jgi:hypothetical protein